MKLSTQITLGFLIAISIDLLDSFVNYRLTLRVKRDSEFLSRSEGVIRNSSDLNKQIVNVQNAFRGFLLTGDTLFLQPYTREQKTLKQDLENEKGMVSLAVQRQKLDSIIQLQSVWFGFADKAVVDRRKMTGERIYINLPGTQLLDKLGRNYNDRINDLFNRFDEIEYRVREERRISLANSISLTDRYSLIFSILLILVSIAIAIYLVRKISGRIDSLVRLAGNISQGNFTKVRDDRNDELSGLSVSLNTMSDRLSQNISDLKKRNAELDQFAYVVSHDLKAPIRGISNVVGWIEEDLGAEISSQMRRYLDIIPERIRRLEMLIDGLLEYARIGREQLVTEDVDVGLLVSDIAELIVPEGYRVISAGLPIIRTEKLPLLQVFSNLIGNAVKYNKSRDAAVYISCKDRGSLYEFSVRDNGPGIDPSFHERIFVIFQTLREKSDKESTGIGLALVKKIVEDKEGSIWVVSSPGNGAEFLFTWPKITS